MHLPATTAAIVRRHSDLQPTLGLILGSGFGAVADAVTDAVTLGYGELPGFVPSSVPGHSGRLLLGHLGGAPVAVLAGRLHHYEGHDLPTVVFPVRVLAARGAPVPPWCGGGVRTRAGSCAWGAGLAVVGLDVWGARVWGVVRCG